MDLQLRDKSVLITGATGGIGQALATTFANEGARLVLHGFGQFDRLEPWIRENSWQDRAIAVRADIRAPFKIEAALEEATEKFGRIDIAVVNAGVWPSESEYLFDLSMERIRETLDVNLFGALWTARAFLRCLVRSGPRSDGHGASLVFIGSTAGRFGEAGHTDYAVSKAALRGLVLSLKNEIVHVDPFGRVNLVEPGWTLSPMAKPALEDPTTIRQLLKTTPLQQVARAQDIANVVAMIASPLSNHVTGEVITVAGGMEGRRLWTDNQIDVDAVRDRWG